MVHGKEVMKAPMQYINVILSLTTIYTFVPHSIWQVIVGLEEKS
jgi:hypothetical protein